MSVKKPNPAMRGLSLAKKGVSFFTFGVAGIVISFVVVPIVFICWPRASRARVMRRVISTGFRGFIHLLSSMGTITYSLRDLQHIPAQGLVVANHPSLIDVIFLIGWLPNSMCVVKRGLFVNPFTFGPVRSAGYIDNQAPDFADKLAQALADGERVVVFPEGTRTTPGEMPRLERGAIHVALRCQQPITPVSIHVHPATLTKQQRWWQMPDQRPHFALQAYPNWQIENESTEEPITMQARRVTRALQQFFSSFLINKAEH